VLEEFEKKDYSSAKNRLMRVSPLTLIPIYPWRLSENRDAGRYVSSVRVGDDEPPFSGQQIADLLTSKIKGADNSLW
jgi:hypothetical protein